MDIGYYISELMAQHGDISVPGLGNFTRTRINGHYNEKEGKLYPPAYSILFEPQAIENETLVQYIVYKKAVSLESARYFAEKFVDNIKLQAQTAEAAIGDLGWLYTDGSQLSFKPNTRVGIDPDFFGYQPVTLHKLSGAVVAHEPPAPVEEEPVKEEHTAPIPIPQQQEVTNGYRLETDEEHEAYLTELARKRKRNSTITFVVLALLFTSLAVYLAYRYNPSLFSLAATKTKDAKDNKGKPEVINARVEHFDDTSKTNTKIDTTSPKENTQVKDTLSKITPVVADSISFPRWEIMAASFKTLQAANTTIKNFKTLGYTAHIVEDAPGPRVKVSLGTYKTWKEATAAIIVLHKDKRISKEIYPLEIKHKKQIIIRKAIR